MYRAVRPRRAGARPRRRRGVGAAQTERRGDFIRRTDEGHGHHGPRGRRYEETSDGEEGGGSAPDDVVRQEPPPGRDPDRRPRAHAEKGE